MSIFFDTHCHLPDDCTPENAVKIISEARAANVTRMLFAGTSMEDCPGNLELAAANPGVVYTSVGIHPEAYRTFTDDAADTMRKWLKAPGVVAIGEIGLDAHYEDSDPAAQERILRVCLELAAESGLPVVIHCREAFERCFPIVREMLSTQHPIQIHSFADGPAELEKWMTMNTMFSYNGMVTFKKAENIRETLRLVPLERMLLETDAPYLAPVPFRGQQNESRHIPVIAARIAGERNLTLAEIADITTANACRFFRI
jgi:TatD DNase family protein